MSTDYTPTTVSGDNTETAINQNLTDIQDALKNSLSRNSGDEHGSNAMQTNIDANGNQIINLREAQTDSEAVTLKQLSDKLADFGIDSALVSDIEASVAAIEAATAGNESALINHKWAAESDNVPLTSYVNSEFDDTGLTPTYVSSSTFTVPGDQTAAHKLIVGKRLKIVHNGGTEYKDITAVAYQVGPDNTLVTVNGTSLVSPVSSVAVGPGNSNLDINAVLIRDAVNNQDVQTTLDDLDAADSTLQSNITALDSAKIDKIASPSTGNLVTQAGDGNLSKSTYSPTTVPGAFGSQYLRVISHKAQGTHGGTASSGSNVRDLTSTVTNTISGVTVDLGSDFISLPAGTYYCTAYSIGYAIGILTVIWNKTAGASLLHSNNSYSASVAMTNKADVSGRIVLASPADIELRTYAGGARATDGLGHAVNISGFTEIYGEIQLWKIA